MKDPLPSDPHREFDVRGTILSAAGLILIVLGILAADDNGWLMLGLLVTGVLVLVGFFISVRAKERSGHEPLIRTSIFRNRTSNLGLITQNVQWMMLLGVSFVVASYLQVVRGYNAIESGVIFTAATVGLLVSSFAAGPLARKFPQKVLIIVGFVLTILGIVVFIVMAGISQAAWAFAPGLLVIGLGVGAMLTSSVNVVQSSFPDSAQSEISGVSRSISNLGSSLGTAIAGTILVAGLATNPGANYAIAMLAMGAAGLVGLVAAFFLPRKIDVATEADAPAA
jgi:MFS family permease